MPEPINPPIVASSTFRFADNEEALRALRGEALTYSRWDNPTVQAVEAELARLCGAKRALAFGSGMAAISSALICALRDCPRLLCQGQVYGGTLELCRGLLPSLGIEVRFFDVGDWAAALADAGADGRPWGAVFAETPTNPTLRVVDVAGLAAASHRLGAQLLVDGTFAGPALQQTLALGADLELHSATKSLAGHHDLLAGVVAGRAELIQRLWGVRKLLGGILDPFPANLLQRGLKTLALRVERQSATAQRVAEWLAERREVRAVHYPGLATHPEHALARAQMTGGFGGMLSFELADYAAAVRVSDALRTFHLAPSLGGTESLVSLPLSTSHGHVSPEERARFGIADGLVRLSIGLEPFEALRDDLERALAGVG